MCFCFRRHKRDSPPPGTFSPSPVPYPYNAPQTSYISPPPTAVLPKSSPTVTTYRTYQPTFPLRPKPSCRRCNNTPRYRSTVHPLNQNGNGDRPYYVCAQCKENPTTASGPNGKGWITWDDNKGVAPSNPKCNCGFLARQDRAGVNSYAPGQGFWTCCTGACAYLSWRSDGRTKAEAGGWNEGFLPWLI